MNMSKSGANITMSADPRDLSKSCRFLLVSSQIDFIIVSFCSL